MARKRKKTRGSSKSRGRKAGAEKTAPPSEEAQPEDPSSSPAKETPSNEKKSSAEKKSTKAKKSTQAKKGTKEKKSTKAPAKKKTSAKKTAAAEESSKKEPPVGEKEDADEATAPKKTGEKKTRKKKTGKKQSRKGKKKAAAQEQVGEPVRDEPADDEPEAMDPPEVLQRPRDESVETVVISLDDEEDDDAARARLIAEALAFVEAEEGSAADGPTEGPASDEVEVSDDGPTGDATDDAADEGDSGSPDRAESDEGLGAPDEAPGVAARGEEAANEAADAEPARPQLSPDALVALSELRMEGVALPGELVVDLGDASTPDERDRLLAATLAHAEMQEARYRIPLEERRDTWIKLGIATTLLVVALFVAVVPPGFLLPDPPPALRPADTIAGVRVTLVLQAQAIEAFRATSGRLPTSLEEVEGAFPDVRYLRSTNRLYQLVAYTPDGEPVIYDSASPAPELQRVADVWAPGEERR